MKRRIILLLLLLYAMLSYSLLKPSDTIRNYAFYLKHNYTYEKDIHDYWQTPLETILRGKGDCEDLAILSHAVLSNKGYKPQIYAFTYYTQKGLSGHAVCLVRGKVTGKYYLISDTHVFETPCTNAVEAILKTKSWKHLGIRAIYLCKPTRFGRVIGLSDQENLLLVWHQNGAKKYYKSLTNKD